MGMKKELAEVVMECNRPNVEEAVGLAPAFIRNHRVEILRNAEGAENQQIACLADIHAAVSDPNGKLTRDELVAHVRTIVVERDLLRAAVSGAEGRANMARAWLRECVELMDPDEPLTMMARKLVESSTVCDVDNDDRQ